MDEAAVAAVWQSGCIPVLTSDDGQRVHVLYPGRRARRPGCDFQDAVLMIGGRRVTGDVEIHVKSSLWKSHGHGLNPLYEGIVLHVVFMENGGLPALTAGGRPVPTVALNAALGGSAAELQRIGLRIMPSCIYAAGKERRLKLPGLLAAAGLERFAGKVERSLQSMLQDGPDQALYCAIARSLGYALNARPMEELSRLLPLKRLQDFCAGGLRFVLAAVLETSALLYAQVGQGASKPYDPTIEGMQRQSRSPDVRISGWNLRARPANHPVRRLEALAALVYRYRDTGLYRGLSDLLECRNGSGLRMLEQGLLVGADETGEEYYPYYYCGRPAALLGHGRAAEIIINAVLPCLAAGASLKADRASEYRITSLYLGYAGAPFNEITRYMQEMLRLRPGDVRGACRQQGLLHLYHSCCREKNCAACPVFRLRN
jgi:hypothetical protein